MKNKFIILTLVCLLLIMGAGCKQEQGRVSDKKFQEIKNNYISASQDGGPFGDITFIMHGNRQGWGFEMHDPSNDKLVVNLHAGQYTSTTDRTPTMVVTAENKSINNILSTTPSGNVIYSYKFNDQIIDEVRCFTSQNEKQPRCERYLAIDPHRSLTLVDYESVKLNDSSALAPYELFDFELRSQKPTVGEWEKVDSFKDLPFTVLRPKSLNLATSHSEPLPITADLFYASARSSAEQPAVHIEMLKDDTDKLIAEEKRNHPEISSSTQEVVNSIPVTSVCYSKDDSKVCNYYFSRPGQDTVRVTEYSNLEVYKTLQFKRYYPYDPIQILTNSK